MSTYRVAHDWRITIVRDDDEVVAAVNRDHAELAERIVRLLNAEDQLEAVVGLHFGVSTTELARPEPDVELEGE